VQFVDVPKLLSDPQAVADRLRLRDQPHVASLTAFAGRLRLASGAGAGVPDFDPWDGGVRARCLFLLEAPGARAVGSGFVSRNNPDETAKSFWLLNREAGIAREETIVWNVVPWYVGAHGRIRAARANDVRRATSHLRELLEMLPRLETAVLVGRAAQRVGPELATWVPSVRVFSCPHPSPRSLNSRPHLRQEIGDCLRQVRQHLDRAA
jgi:uracil-DNA glycosylase